jgi:hypothetical protein
VGVVLVVAWSCQQRTLTPSGWGLKLTQVEVVVLRIADDEEEDDGMDDG